MNIKIENAKTVELSRWLVNDDYFVEVEKYYNETIEKIMYDFHLHNRYYGTKMFMFALIEETMKKCNLTVEDAIINNIEDNIKIYQNLYED